ncbi:MAG: pyrroline-5-carboxylate reductase [Thermodesulfovibrionales bacterium]
MIGFIGGGNMAEALIKGLTQNRHRDIIFYDPSEQRVKHLMIKYGVGFVGSNIEVIKRSSIVILAVKPQTISQVLEEIKTEVRPQQIIVSIAAGIKIGYISGLLSTNRVIRVMPNMPAMFEQGMSVISVSDGVLPDEVQSIVDIFKTVGEAVVMDESMMDAVTALSGSGPGFFAYIVEAFIRSAMHLGLTQQDAYLLTIQTFIGTAKVLQSGLTPERLREMVTSPNGTTYAGLNVLRQGGIDDIILSTLMSAKNRAEELGSSR